MHDFIAWKALNWRNVSKNIEILAKYAMLFGDVNRFYRIKFARVSVNRHSHELVARTFVQTVRSK